MIISIVTNLYQTDTCNQIPPPNFPASRGLSRQGKNERKERDSFLSFLPRRERPLLAGNHPTCQTPEMRKIVSNCHPKLFRFLH